VFVAETIRRFADTLFC